MIFSPLRLLQLMCCSTVAARKADQLTSLTAPSANPSQKKFVSRKPSSILPAVNLPMKKRERRICSAMRREVRRENAQEMR